MADEIKLNTRMTVVNGDYRSTFAPAQLVVTQATLGASSGIIQVGISEEDLTPVDISTNGWLILHNLDETNYVTYGPKSGGSMVAFGRLDPTEYAVLRLAPGVTIRWQANTATCKVYYLLLED